MWLAQDAAARKWQGKNPGRCKLTPEETALFGYQNLTLRLGGIIVVMVMVVVVWSLCARYCARGLSYLDSNHYINLVRKLMLPFCR